jgi:spore coat polysaccharide biosynthesis protein SpsF (cytidylyltransferase family)/MoaA/NifB/PqqE/SkfB family radical SAM enzyme
MKITAIIKASSISKNFPDRYKLRLGGKSILESIVNRIQESQFINEIVLATTNDGVDDELVATAKKLGIEKYRGIYGDSIGRLYGAANLVKADVIVKILGNYPLVDPWESDRVFEEFLSSDYTYAYNEHCDGIILGLGVEVFKFGLLEQLNSESTSPVQRRLGTNIFKDAIDKSNILLPAYRFHRPNYRVTLAVQEDVDFLNRIIEECDELNYAGIVRFLDENPIIVKYAQHNISVPKEVGVEKILLFPSKVTSINQCSINNVDFSYPVSVELSLTNKCNLSCEWCSDNALRKKSMVDIDFDILQRLFQDLAENGTRGVVIEGGGEPTMYPRFNDVLMCAKDYGLSLGLITNGVRFQYENKLDCFDWIRVSLDATAKGKLLGRKGDGLFNVVMSNIQKITKRKEDNGLVVGVGYVLTKFNEENLEELVLNLRRIDVDYVQIRPVIDYPEMLPKNFDLDYLKKHSTSEFSINVHNMSENIIKGNSNVSCRVHSLSSVIAANGDVFLCGRLNIYDWVKPIGNLYENTFYEIWHSEERIKQSDMVLDSEFCRKWCPECRLTKYNVVFNNTSEIKTKNFI